MWRFPPPFLPFVLQWLNSDVVDIEDEDDQDDILIVEGEDEDYEPDTSPEMRKTTKISDCKPRAISNCATSLQEGGSKGGLTPANKSLNASQEGVST